MIRPEGASGVVPRIVLKKEVSSPVAGCRWV